MMNLAFNLHSDKGLRDDLFGQPYKLMSLWEMLRFYAEDFLKMGFTLAGLCRFSSLPQAEGIRKTLEDILGPGLSDLRKLHRNLTAMGFCASAASAARMIAALDDSEWDNVPVQQFAISLFDNIVTEFQNETALVIPAGRAKYYQMPGTFLTEESIQRLPSLTRDADEAGNCFAAGRYTACVFHLMRVMERIVQEFANMVGATKKDGSPIDVKNEEWYQIELAIEKVINVMPKGDEKVKRSKVLTALGAVRLGWRNPTMHPSQCYTAEEAEV